MKLLLFRFQVFIVSAAILLCFNHGSVFCVLSGLNLQLCVALLLNIVVIFCTIQSYVLVAERCICVCAFF